MVYERVGRRTGRDKLYNFIIISRKQKKSFEKEKERSLTKRNSTDPRREQGLLQQVSRDLTTSKLGQLRLSYLSL